MKEYELRPVNASHNERMLEILRSSPINAGGLTLCFDKSPDIFRIPTMKYSESGHLGFFMDDRLDGFASIGYHDALIGGNIQKVFTLFHFYLLQCARGRHLPGKAARIFIGDASLKSSYGYYLTMKGNFPVESYIGRHDHSWMPHSEKISEIVVRSIIFSVPRRNKSAYNVRNARIEDVPDIVRLLRSEHEKRDLGLVITEESFLQNLEKRSLGIGNYYVASDKKGRMKGVCLAWDCSSFRRTIVQQFSPKFYHLLFLYRLAGKVLPMAPFPGKGECFRELTVTDYATEDRDVTVMHALLSEIYHRNSRGKYHFMNFGSCRNDQLLNATRGFWFTDVVSSIVLIALNPSGMNISMKLPYIDIAFL